DDVTLVERSRQGCQEQDRVGPRIGAEALERGDELALRSLAGKIDLVDRYVELLPARREALLVSARGRVDAYRDRCESRRDPPGVQRRASLARLLEQPPRGLGHLEWDPRRREERGLHAVLPLLLFLIGLPRKLHRLGDARVRGAVIPYEP